MRYLVSRLLGSYCKGIRESAYLVSGIYFLVAGGPSCFAGCPLPIAGGVAWWSAEGNANDSVGTNNGTLMGGATYAAGEVGQAFSLNGTDGFVQVPDSGLWGFGTNNFTIELWANFNAVPPGSYSSPQGGVFISNDEGGGNQRKWWFALGGGNLEFHINNPGSGAVFLVRSAFTPTLNQWYHFAVVRSNTSYTIFTNGVLIGTDSTTIPVPSPNAPLTIGQAEGNFFNGLLDEVTIYTNALPTNIIAAIYNAGARGKCGLSLNATARATAIVFNNFVVGANITFGGAGYTNGPPVVRFFGGGGSGAAGFTSVTNGVVTSITVTNAGYGYTNPPEVVIEPPFILNPTLNIASMTFLTFSNLTTGGVYQLQNFAGWFWTNQPVSFTATSTIYTQFVAGVAGTSDYRLALNPLPSQAFATAQVVNGFVVGATVTVPGSGYVANPTVTIAGGGGSNATAVSHISAGSVTNISITSAGIAYTNTPTIRIAPPPAAVIAPSVLPVMRIDGSSLAPYDNYQIQFRPDLNTPWADWPEGLFTPTDVVGSGYVFITNDMGFFRVLYVP